MHRASILLLPPVSAESLDVSFFEDILPKLCRFFLGILGYVPLAFAGRSKPYLRFKTPGTRQNVLAARHQYHMSAPPTINCISSGWRGRNKKCNGPGK